MNHFICSDIPHLHFRICSCSNQVFSLTKLRPFAIKLRLPPLSTATEFTAPLWANIFTKGVPVFGHHIVVCPLESPTSTIALYGFWTKQDASLIFV